MGLMDVSAMKAAGRGLRVTVEGGRSAVVLYAGGEVDAHNAMMWKRLLGEAAQAAATPGVMIVDTNDMQFMGLRAYAAMAEQSKRCQHNGIRFCMADSQKVTARVIASARMETELALYPNVHAAVQDCEPADTLSPRSGSSRPW